MARERKRKRKSSADQTAVQTPVSVRGGLEGGWYKPLTDEAIQQIHDASVEVLERVGIQVFESEAREIFRAGGARIDESKDRVYISKEMIEKARETAPNNVILYGRDDPRHDIDLGGKRVYLGTGGAAVKVLDLDGHVRESELKDVALIGQLCDALDNIHFYLRPCVARDLSNQDLDINTFYAAMANTTKHVTGNVFTRESLADIIEMAEMIAGGKEELRAKPTISFTSCWTVAPLRYAPETVEVLIDICRAGLPVFLSSAPQSGATSPAALAGSLVQINAEELSGLVFTQLVNPGCPIVLGYVPSVSDLRSGNFVGGAPEFAMMNAAVCQLGQFYNLPVYNSSGLTDSKIPDAQAGYEKGITGLAVALAGANYVHHSAGFLESLLTIAYESYVMDDDFNGSIMRMVRGIEVTPETL
ncbi:MAG: trimethylamine methyltransferase family protein, partial [Chloroflexota bacterium]